MIRVKLRAALGLFSGVDAVPDRLLLLARENAPQPSTRTSLPSTRLLFFCRKAVSDVFARISAAADGDDDVLLAVDHVSHRRAALRSRHQTAPTSLPVALS